MNEMRYEIIRSLSLFINNFHEMDNEELEKFIKEDNYYLNLFTINNKIYKLKVEIGDL